MDRHGVPDISSGVRYDKVTVSSLCIAGLRVVLCGGRGRLANTEDIGPFENLLAEVLVIEGSVAENRFE